MRKTTLGIVLLPLLCAAGIVWGGEHGHEGFGFGGKDGGDEHHGGKKRPKQLAVPVNAPKVWKTECGSCHMAYPPGLLPAAAWARQMDTLKNHYGSNATLSKEDELVIRRFLAQASAANQQPLENAKKTGEPPRITSSAWFLHKHDEVRAQQWKRKAVGSASNCVACHAGAEKGNFSEHEVRIPR